MLKTLLLKILKPNHQPEMIVAQSNPDNAFSRSVGEAFAAELVRGYWTRNKEANAHHSQSMIKAMTEKLMADCRKVLSSPDPRLANRKLLAESVRECARLQVLVISPEPAHDGTGLRGQLGISGELQARVLDIIKADAEFQKFPEQLDLAKASNQIQYAYRRAWACMNIFEGFRHEFEDFNPEMSQDWFRPFFASQCAHAESHYRRLLGLPATDAGQGEMYGSYMDAVLSGDRYPDASWEALHPGLTNPKLIWNK